MRAEMLHDAFAFITAFKRVDAYSVFTEGFTLTSAKDVGTMLSVDIICPTVHDVNRLELFFANFLKLFKDVVDVHVMHGTLALAPDFTGRRDMHVTDDMHMQRFRAALAT